MHIQHVATEYIQQVWPVVEPYIHEALEKGTMSSNYNAHHVQQFLASGQWLLVVAIDDENTVHGAMTISFINYPIHRVAFITATGGKSIINPEMLDQLKMLMKARGATKIQALARASMARLLEQTGFEAGNISVEVKL
jgi:hypothetical protein